MKRQALFWRLYLPDLGVILIWPIFIILLGLSDKVASLVLVLGASLYGIFLAESLRTVFQSSFTLVLPTSERFFIWQVLRVSSLLLLIATLPLFLLADLLTALYIYVAQLCAFWLGFSSNITPRHRFQRTLKTANFGLLVVLVLAAEVQLWQADWMNMLWLSLFCCYLAMFSYFTAATTPPRRILTATEHSVTTLNRANRRHRTTETPERLRHWLSILRFENQRSGRWQGYFLMPFLTPLIFLGLASLIDDTEPASWQRAARLCFQEPPQPLQVVFLVAVLLGSLASVGRLEFKTSLLYPLTRRERANCAFVDGLWLTSMNALGALLSLLFFWAAFLLLAGQELQVDLLLPYLRALALSLLLLPVWKAAVLGSRSPWVRDLAESAFPLIILVGGFHAHGLQLPDVGSWRPVVWLLLLSIPAQAMCWLGHHRYFQRANLTKASNEEPDKAEKAENRLWAKVEEWSKGGP